MKNKNITFYYALSVLILCFAFSSCEKNNQNTLPQLDISGFDPYITEMTSILDTAVIGDVDGTYPVENHTALQKALEQLEIGKSKAEAGAFVLQYEIDNYYIAARKAIQDFYDSFQITLPAGTFAELKVFGIDQKGHIDFGSSPDYAGSGAFTVELYAKYSAGFFEGAMANLLGTFCNTAVPFEGWTINFLGSNIRGTFGFGPQTGLAFEFGAAYPTNYEHWNHIALVYEESAAEDNIRMFLNGKPYWAKTNDVLPNKYQPNVVNQTMWAFMEPTDNSRCMTGFIKKMRIWSGAKTETEINTLMNTDVTGQEAGLLCAWDFTVVPEDTQKIPDKTGRHSAKIVGKHKWFETK